MAKKVYRVKKGDDFFKISRKLYGDASYAMDLIRANPGFDYVGPGMVLRLPKLDPRVKRQRKMKRREKLYGKPEPPDEQAAPQSEFDWSQYEDVLGMMEDPGEVFGDVAPSLEVEDYDSGAELSQDDELPDWLADPKNQERWADAFVETAVKMGFDLDAMMEEFGMGEVKEEPEVQPAPPPAPPPQMAGDEADDPAEPDQSGTQYPEPETPPQPDGDEEGRDDTSEDVSDPPAGDTEGDTDDEEAAKDESSQQPAEGIGPGKGLMSDLRSDLSVEEMLRAAAMAEAYTSGEGVGQGGQPQELAPTAAESSTQEAWDPEIPSSFKDRKELRFWFEDQMGKSGLDPWQKEILEQFYLEKRNELDLGDYVLPDEYYEAEGERRDLIEKDYDILFYKGLPESGVFYPEGHFLNHSGFGDGFEKWDTYYIPGAERNVAQNMSPHRLVSDEIENGKKYKLKDSYNANLCGQLAVIAALGIDLEAGMDIFAELSLRGFDKRHYRGLDDDPNDGVTVSTGYDILQKDFATTTQTIIDFIRKAGGEDLGLKVHETGEEPIDTPEKFAENLTSGNIVIACVTIDTAQNGKIMDLESSSSDTSHWVWVQDIITTKDDETLVRVYNPYMNREEVYDWATFSEAYRETTNESDNMAVVASFRNSNQ